MPPLGRGARPLLLSLEAKARAFDRRVDGQWPPNQGAVAMIQNEVGAVGIGFGQLFRNALALFGGGELSPDLLSDGLWIASLLNGRGRLPVRAYFEACLPGEITSLSHKAGDVGGDRLALGPVKVKSEENQPRFGGGQVLVSILVLNIVGVGQAKQGQLFLAVGIIADLIGADILFFDLPPLGKKARKRFRCLAEPKKFRGRQIARIQKCGRYTHNVGYILLAGLEENKPFAWRLGLRVGLYQDAARLHIVPFA